MGEWAKNHRLRRKPLAATWYHTLATMLMKHRIAQLAIQAAEAAQRQGTLPSGPIPDIEVERPQNPEHGDFAISLPLRLARAARMNPMAIAERLVPLLPADDTFQRVWAEPPRLHQLCCQTAVASTAGRGRDPGGRLLR